MLRQVSIALAKRSKLLTSVARTAASLQQLDREMRDTECHYALQLDWSDSGFLELLEPHCSAVGYPSLVVAWLHDDDLAPRIATRIGAASEGCRFFHVRSSAAADPALGTERLAKAWADVPVQHYEIIFRLSSNGVGISLARKFRNLLRCVTALERGARKTVIGVVSPWADRGTSESN